MMRKLIAENFGGIEFVRVCSLSRAQQKLFSQSQLSKKVIIIKRHKELLYDCLSYKDYHEWYSNNLTISTQEKPASVKARSIAGYWRRREIMRGLANVWTLHLS